MVHATLEEREGHVTVILEDVGKPLLETTAVLYEVLENLYVLRAICTFIFLLSVHSCLFFTKFYHQ